MSNLSTFAEVGLVDARASAGTLILPSSRDIPGRVITFKDIYGAVGNSTIALLASTGDVFEDGTSYRTLANPYDFITLYAGSTNVWYTIGGTQFNALRVPIMSNSSNLTSSITANTINSAFVNTSFLYPQTGLTFTTTSNLLPPLNAGVNTGASIGNITSNYLQIFSQSTVTSNLVATSQFSTIFAGASITPAYSTNRISTLSLGNPTNRWFQTFSISTITSTINADNAFGTTLSYQTISTQNIVGFNLLGTTILSTQQLFCSSIQIGATDSILDIIGPLRTQDMSTITLQASTITSGTMNLNRLLGVPVTLATTTQNLNPLTVGAQIGFGSNTGQLGFYAEGHFRSTNTQVIIPTFDNDGFSNVIRIEGNVSTQNINVSSIFGRIISTTTLNTTLLVGPAGGGAVNCGNLYPQGVNILGFGTGGPGNGPWDSASIRQTFTSSIITNNISSGVINVSTLTTNALTIGSGSGFVNIPFIQTILASTIQINNTQLNTSNITLSSINRKLYPYASTLGIPASTFTLSGTVANSITNPLVLYSNVRFPHAGFFNISQSAIFSRTSATTNVPQASIFYTPGIYPSTISNVDGYASLPYLGNANASTFTTLAETLYISTTQFTRNIIYSDPTGNAYTANLFMSPITLQYIPNNSLNPE